MTTDLPKAIIFDMDDTILSDDAAADRCWRQVCHDMFHRIRTGTPEELGSVIQEIRRWYWADPERIRRGSLDLGRARLELLSLAFERYGIEDTTLMQEMSDAYQKLKSATIELIPGALDTLAYLRDSGTRLGLITNGDADVQRSKVVKAGLEPCFDSVVIAGEFGVAKPDPRIFDHSLARLQTAPGEAWMVGDNLYADIGAPRPWVSTGYGLTGGTTVCPTTPPPFPTAL